jgi:hypothetical protein
VWLEKAQRAGFTDLLVLRRQPMTIHRLMPYPVYQEGLLENLFALLPPEQHDHLVLSVLIAARSGGVPRTAEQGDTCSLPISPLQERTP